MINTQVLINDALVMLDVKAIGEGVDNDAVELAVRTLNDLLQTWSINPEINPHIYTAEFDAPILDTNPYLTSGITNPANDIPVDIAQLTSVKLSLGQIVYNLIEIPYTQYLSLSLKNVHSTPRYYAFDYQYPQAKIYFHLLPAAGYAAQVIYKPAIATVRSASDNLQLPDWWRPALLWGLANSLTEYFPNAAYSGASKDLIYHSTNHLKAIKRRVMQANRIKVAPGYRSGSNARGTVFGTTFDKWSA